MNAQWQDNRHLKMNNQELGDSRGKTAELVGSDEKRFRQLFESMSEGCAIHQVIYDDLGKAQDYVIVDINPAYEQIIGLKKDSVTGKKASDIYNSSEPPYLDIYNAVASSGKPCSFETYFPPMKKHFGISVFSPAKGSFATVFSDITERKNAEVALQQEYDRLDLITSSIGVGLAIISKEYHTLWSNKVLRDIFGDVEGRPCYESFNAKSEICTGCGVKEVFDTGISQVVHEQLGKDTRGNDVWSQIVATPFKDKFGNTTGALEAVMIITERKQAEQALQEEGKMRAQFIDVLAHELKSPLSPILTSTEILSNLLETSSDEKLKRLSNNAYSGARILSSRLDELLEMARYSRGAFTLNTKSIDISQFVGEVSSRYRPTIEQSGHKLVVLMPDRLPAGEIDPSRMEQVLINLLSNASKYSPAGTTIELSVRTDPNSLLFEVKDAGKGLSEIDQKTLFQPYHRLKEDRQNSPGLGLGLWICRQIIEAHGGQIAVESKPGRGSTFKISLPLQKEGEATPPK